MMIRWFFSGPTESSAPTIFYKEKTATLHG